MWRAINGVLALALLSNPATGQPPAETAPVPSQILTAKKIFISNAPGEVSDIYPPERLYSQFYAAVKSWGQYELVSAPGDADLVFEVSFINPIVGVSGGVSISDPQFRLVILDPETHVSLWWLTAHVQPANLRGSRIRNFDQAVAGLKAQAKQLISRPANTSNDTRK
ncbi:MAG TPA: hypothetical protein VGV15_07355 [Terriglobales bacterium]|nr:hypothetical protein [Terriglobales bacterium]